MGRAESICGIVLAAGFSTRMGREKALLPWPPVTEATPPVNTFLGAAIDLLQQYTELVIVVAGTNAAAIGAEVYAHGGFLTINPEPQRGQFSSIQTGLHEVLNRGRDAAFLAPVDRPPVLPGTLRDLRDAFLESTPEVWAVVPEYRREGEAVHGHPILVAREMMEAFLREPSESTARDVEHRHQQHVRYLPVDDVRVAINIDTAEAYERLRSMEVTAMETPL